MTQIIIPVISAVIAIAGTLGVAYAVFRTATTTKTLELYKGENEVQGKAIARQSLTLVDQDARIAALERENDVLRNLVIGHEQLEMLVRDTVARSVQHEAQLTALHEIKEVLTEMWQSLVRLLAESGERGT